VSDLARIPEKYGVSNVFAELGTVFAVTAISNPRYCAAILGTLVKGVGADHVLWGTDSVWYGSPQWQIEAFRRIEIPKDLQKKFGFAPLGAVDGTVRNAVFGRNAARLYRLMPIKVKIARSLSLHQCSFVAEKPFPIITNQVNNPCQTIIPVSCCFFHAVLLAWATCSETLKRASPFYRVRIDGVNLRFDISQVPG
jgi:hypothetical protein